MAGGMLSGRRLPRHAAVCFIVMLLAQFAVFYGTRPLLPLLPSHDLATALDRRIPFRPAWVVIYVLAFADWIVGILRILWADRLHAHRIAGAYVLAMLISCAVFLLYPGTMTRPEPAGDDLFSWIVRLIYRLDSPTNLCPSLHVLINYFCWRGTVGRREIPGWYKWFGSYVP